MAAPPHPLLAALQPQLTLRRYQAEALAVAEQQLADPTHAPRLHLVAPPGAGKTILGLELIRRLGHPALVLAPNTAIQRQWADKVRFFLPPDGSLPAAHVVAEGWQEPPPPLLSLTYQSLAVATRESALLDDLALALWREEAGDPARPEALRAANPDAFRAELRRFRSRVRARLLDEPTFDATTLLHPSARTLVAALVARGTRTVVLDECHHLTGTWAILLGALLRRLPDVVVIGLTATPPVDRSNRERLRYLDLVGEIDFQVPTPAVVRDGNLAPYQDLVLFTVPTPGEMRFVAGQHAQWQTLLGALNAEGQLDGWIRGRLAEPCDDRGDAMPWPRFAERRATLATALVRWALAHEWPLPDSVQPSREQVAPLTDEDRLRLIADFALRHLKLSPQPEAQARYRQLKVAGRALGFQLTEGGFRRTVAPVDRLLSLSRSKAEGALTILRHEWAALGERLRAVVICDFEQSSATVLRELDGVLDSEAESALGVMRLLAASDLEGTLRPVLVTGKTLLCDDTIAAPFVAAARRWFAAQGLEVTLHDEQVEGASFHRLVGSGPDWRSGSYVAMVTALLEEGVTRCLVGTRALLGEGWDSLALNTFIDLTYATTFAAVNQLRGRALRLDPAWPDKVADNWDVVCIAPGFEKGMQDFERFVRKHESFFGISDDGVIEAGVGHVHPALHALSGAELGAERATINGEMLARPARRAQAAALWRVGSPYEDRERVALYLRYPLHPATLSRVGHARRSEAVGALRPLAALGTASVAAIALAPLVATLGAGLIQAAAEAWLAGGLALGPLRLGIGLTWLLFSLGLLGRSLLLTVRAIGQRFWSSDATTTAHALGRAVLEAMQATELLPRTLPAEALRVTEREDGFVRLWLEAEESAAVERFAHAVAELLGPVTAEARYMIPRYELLLPTHPLGRWWRWLQWATNRWAGEVAAWHPVPSELGARAERVRAFEEAWQRHVSPGEALFLHRPEGAARLRAARALPPRVERRPKRIWR